MARTCRRVGSAGLVHVDQVDADVAPAEGADDRTQRTRGAPAAADHLAQVVRVDPYLEHAPATEVARAHADIVGVIDDPLDQVLEGLLEHRQPSLEAVWSPLAGSVAAPASVPALGSSAGFSAFSAFSAFLPLALVVVAPP